MVKLLMNIAMVLHETRCGLTYNVCKCDLDNYNAGKCNLNTMDLE